MFFHPLWLHPLGHHDPSFVCGDSGDSKITKPRPPLRHDPTLAAANDPRGLLIDLCHHERRSVPEDVIVTKPPTRVGEIQVIVVRDPMLLSVVNS